MKIAARAYAKINWILSVGGLRPDGYHDLVTLFQTVDLYDELELAPATELSLEIVDNRSGLKTDETNLVMRAARALRQALSTAAGAAIRLKKRIPMGGGLGGGSSDAAATLVALNELWRGGLTRAQLAEIGAQLGSDVPFFLTGGTAWGRGRGTEIVPVDDIEAPFLLLVNPRLEVPTPAAYREFDRLTSAQALDILTTCSFSSADSMFAQAHNSLSPAVARLAPVIPVVEARLAELGGCPVLMSGSGATVWARFATQRQCAEAATALAGSGWLVIETRALGRDEYWRAIINAVA